MGNPDKKQSELLPRTRRTWRDALLRAQAREEPQHRRNYTAVLGTIGLFFLRWLDEQSVNSDFSIPEECRWRYVSSDPSGKLLSEAIDVLEKQPSCQRYAGILQTLGLKDLADTTGRLEHLLRQVSATPVQRSDRTDRSSSWMPFAGAIKDLGWVGLEFSTPPELTALVAGLVKSHEASTVYDPVCGMGNLLATTASESTSGTTEQLSPTLFGQDINASMAALTEINCMINGFNSFSIHMGDVLENPQIVDGNDLRRFDRVVADIPALTLKDAVQCTEPEADTFRRFSYGSPKRDAHLLFLQHVIASLNEKGKAVVLIDASALIAREEASIRQKIVDDDLIEAVISIPVGFGPTFTKNVLVLNKNKPERRRKKILFVYAREELSKVEGTRKFLSDDNCLKIENCVESYSQQQRFSNVVSTDTLSEGCLLAPERHVDLIGRDTFLGGTVLWKTLADVATISRGTKNYRVLDEGTVGGVPLVRLRDVSRTTLSPNELPRVDISEAPDKETGYLELQDILVQGGGSLPKCRSVDESLRGALAEENVYILRLKEEFSYLSQYLTGFLNSHLGQSLLFSRVLPDSSAKLDIRDLQDVPVPIPDDGVVSLINDLHSLEQDLLERTNKARSIRRELFDIDDSQQVSADLRRLSTESQVLAGSLLQADDLRFRVQNFYPFPLAYAYRTLSSYHEPATLYQEQLRIVENVLAFLATVGMSLVADSRPPHDDQGPLSPQELRQNWMTGMSPGHWLSLGQASGRLLRNTDSLSLGQGFSSLWFKSQGKPKPTEFAQLLGELVNEKNDLKHDRGPKSTYEYERQAKILDTRLEELFEALSLFVQHPVRLVQSMDVDWRTSRFLLSTLSYTGDHPGLRQERIISAQGLPIGKLYIASSNEKWISLYPLVSVQHCERCGARETYFVDKWKDASRVPTFKSFEQGHAHSQGDIAREISEDLSHWLETSFSQDSP